MQGMVSLLVVVVMVVVSLPHASSILCYNCEGYNPAAQPDELTNNQACPQDTLNVSAILHFEGSECMAVVREYQGEKVTQRGISSSDTRSTARGSDYNTTTLRGYFCDTDYCNDRDPSAAPPTPALCLPLLLAALLTTLPCYLAQ